jgi:hypothetical protein
MKGLKFMFMVFILSLALILIRCTPKYDLSILNVGVIDIETCEVSTSNIYIKDSLIVEIDASTRKDGKPSFEIIDGTGKYLIPGLWDMHVHIQDSTYLSMFLEYGITGVRDMGGCIENATDGCESLCPEQLNGWKEAIGLEELEGPHLVIAGKPLSGTGWPTSFPVSTREEVEFAFERNLKNKVDFIKVYENIPWDSYQEIARLSKLYNLDFVGHVSEPYLLSDILDLGQKSIEHLREPLLYSFTKDTSELENFMIADGYSEEDRVFVQPWLDDAENVVEAFKRNQAWFTPTMAVQYARSRYQDDLWINHPLRERMPPSVNDGMKKHIRAMMDFKDHKGDSLWWMALTKLVKRFNVENIGLLAGSDSACEGGLPGFTLHEELFLMVEEAGLSPIEALRTATINPCVFLGYEKSGKIAPSFYADLVLLDKNPLENIENTTTINTVIKNGKIQRRIPNK